MCTLGVKHFQRHSKQLVLEEQRRVFNTPFEGLPHRGIRVEVVQTRQSVEESVGIFLAKRGSIDTVDVIRVQVPGQ